MARDAYILTAIERVYDPKYTLNTKWYFKLLPTCFCILVKLNRATNTLYESYIPTNTVSESQPQTHCPNRIYAAWWFDTPGYPGVSNCLGAPNWPMGITRANYNEHSLSSAKIGQKKSFEGALLLLPRMSTWILSVNFRLFCALRSRSAYDVTNISQRKVKDY